MIRYSSTNKLLLLVVCALAALQAQVVPAVSQNVNMVSGTGLGTGDPFLTKQNESTIAVSSLNPAHLIGGSNDSRLIDFSELSDIPGEQTGDSWISLYKSKDGGRTWVSAPLPGCPLNIPECNSPASPVKGYQFASDPTVRSGPYGTFFYSFLAGNRGENAPGVIAVQRIVDRNDNLRVNDDPFTADVANIIDQGNAGQFKDKPWNATDQPGRSWNTSMCLLPGRTQAVPSFSVYVAYSNFVGNSTDNPHPQIYVARSHDCGATFEKPVKVSASIATNQGSVVAVDPLDGTVYVAWRQFFTETNQTPHGIYIAKSTDGGKSFDKPVLIANIDPFDQGPSLATRFRSNALPAMAVSVDRNGVSRVHVAWAERAKGPAPQGGGVRGARIMMSTSRNRALTNWTAPRAIDLAGASPNNSFNPNGLGHQLQPSLAFAGGKLAASWIDQRNDHTVGILQLQCPTTAPFYPCKYVERLLPMTNKDGSVADAATAVFTDWIDDAGLKRRHTLDIYAALAEPADEPQFVTTRVSQYTYGSLPNPPGGCGPNIRCPKEIRQLEFNPPNMPIYVKFTRSFIGDYGDIAGRQFIPTPEDARVPFKFNNSAANGGVFHTTWTDNRDVRAPRDGNWLSHQPIKMLSGTGTALVQNTSCVPGRESMKNQNVYTARIGDTVNAFALVNSKLLSSAPRRFSVVVQNLTSTSQSYRLDAGMQASGATASFTAPSMAGKTVLNITIPPNSSSTRTLWASSASDPRARVEVRVYTGDGSKLLTTVMLNPDPKGVFVTNTTGGPDQVANDMTELTDSSIRNTELTNNELTNTELTNTELTNTELTNTELTNNELTNNELTNTELTNTELTNTELTNTELTNNELTNTELTNNELTNTELTNASLSDATFVVTNKGNTDTVLNMKSVIRGVTGKDLPPGYKVQMVVHKLYVTPRATAGATCSFGPKIQNVISANIPRAFSSDPNGDLGVPKVEGDESEAGVALAVGDVARVTYRILSNTGTPLSASDFAKFNVKSIPVGPDATTIPIPLLILPVNLAPGFYGQAYGDFEIPARGGDAPAARAWSATGLPAGMTVDTVGGKGILRGTPTQTGRFTPTIKVQQGLQIDQQVFELLVNKAQATVTLSSLTTTYDGTPKPVTATTAPAGLAVTVTYNGLPTAPVNAGSYSVLATVNSPFYEGSATGTLVINKAPQTITFAALSPKTFGDAPFVISATATSNLTVSFSASGNCTVAGSTVTISGAGSCTITASQNGDANWFAAPPIQQSFAIAKALATVTLGGLSAVYDGTPKAVTVSTSPAGLPVAVMYNGSATAPTNAGSYAVVATVNSPNYEGSAAGTLVIAQASQTIAFAPLPNRTFGDAPFAVSATATSGLAVIFSASGNCTVAGSTVTITGAGSCTVTASQPGNTNWQPATPVPQTFAIAKAAATLTLSGLTQFYDGSAKSVTVTTSPAGLTTVVVTYNGSTTPPTAAGSYAVVATLNNANYAGSASGTLTIIGLATPAPVGNMTESRVYHSATLLPGGEVLIAGGSDTRGGSLASGELYNPTTKTFTATSNNMPNKAAGHTATLLKDGRVLIAGGGNSSSQIYTRATNSFSSTGGMSSQRSFHTATLLNDGRVLLAGGIGNNGRETNSATIFDPATGSFSSTGNLGQGRESHTATLLPDGKVLIAGGRGRNNPALNSAEIYDPATGRFTSAGTMSAARALHQSVTLPGGDVLLIGGTNGSAALNTAEIYSPATGKFTSVGTGALLAARQAFAAVVLQNGFVQSFGGSNGSAVLNSTEVLTGGTAFAGAPMGTARSFHTATVLANGAVLITGGSNGSAAALGTAELYSAQ